MSWSTRGERAYEYRSVRRSGRVTSRYLGGGIPAESAQLFRWLDASRRAERAAEQAAWLAERDQLQAAERLTIEADEAYRELSEAALYATGHHRPSRGRWRKRRTMATDMKPTNPDAPLVTGQEMAELFDRIERSEGDEKKALQAHTQQGVQLLLKWAKRGDERALPALRVLLARRPDHLGRLGIADFAIKAASLAASGAEDVLIKDVFTREIQATADQLAGPNPSPLERLLCQRVALANFDAHHRDIAAIEAEMNGRSPERVEFLTKLRDRSTVRFLAACRSLAVVRKLALPTVQLHMTANPATPPGIVADPAPTTGPRLRIGG
jgi:hypothetical protein